VRTTPRIQGREVYETLCIPLNCYSNFQTKEVSAKKVWTKVIFILSMKLKELQVVKIWNYKEDINKKTIPVTGCGGS
jgi:hypothetical protein